MQFTAADFNIRVTGEGFPLIWGHGLMGSMELEDKLGLVNLGRIAERVRLVRFDARGHGRSTPGHHGRNPEQTLRPEWFRWSHFGNDMLGIMDHLRVGRFIAGGQSMGCATALYAAIAAPERISKLVLVNPPNAWELWDRQVSLFEFMAGLVEEKGMDPLIDMMQQSVPDSAWQYKLKPELKPVFEKSLQSVDPLVLAAVLRGAILSDMPSRDQIARLKVPVLILAWTDDSVHPLESAEELNRLLKDSTLIVARSMNEAQRWTELICEFLLNT